MESNPDLVPFSQLSRAFASTRVVLAKVGPGQLDAPTPCASWDVRALINHFVGSARWGAAAVSGAGQAVTEEDYAAGDFLARYDDTVKAALAAFGSADVPDKPIDLGFAEFSGAGLMGLVARDQFTHGWDLARAIGYHTDLDPGLAGELLGQARTEVLDAYRGPEGAAFFGPVVAAPASAGPADQLAAFLGRTV